MAFLGTQEAELDLELAPSPPINGTEECGRPDKVGLVVFVNG